MKHILLLSLALLGLSTSSFAQKKKTDNKQAPVSAPFADQAHAKNYLIKTSRFAGHCHRAVFNTKKYTGDLGQMVRYERYAKKMYEAGQYRDAIFFSRRARQFGNASLAANGAIPTSDGKFTADEEALSSGTPTDEDLEKTITAAGEPMLTDESLMAGNLGLEIK